MQSTYWLEKVLKMISLKVNALLCTLQHIVTRAMQLSCVNSENFSPNIFLQVFHEKTGPSLTAYYERIYKQIPRRPTSLRRDGVWLAVPQSASLRFINNPFTIKKSESGVRYLLRGLWVQYFLKQERRAAFTPKEVFLVLISVRG